MSVAHVFFAGVFGFAAVLQFNDPNPVPWMLVYAIAALTCGVAVVHRLLASRAAMIVGGVALLWALTYLPSVLRHGEVATMFDQWSMRNAEVLESREMFGLLVVAAWMAVIVWGARRGATVGREEPQIEHLE